MRRMSSEVPTRVGVYRTRRTTADRARPKSPHAWGCTGREGRRRRHLGEVPTRVGVYRSTGPAKAAGSRSPHTRGGVPWPVKLSTVPATKSPHAWGCTGGRPGMTRPCGGSPHTRGGVPFHSVSRRPSVRAKSPHAWGCTVRARHEPTQALGSPHTRGGVPRRARPRTTWPSEVPTRVGVYRGPNSRVTRSTRSPHTRGGVPIDKAFTRASKSKSPHAWGCTLDAAPVGGEFVGIRHRSIFGSREPGVPREVVAMA